MVYSAIIGPVPPYKGGISQFTNQFSKKLDSDVISWKRRIPKFLMKNQTIGEIPKHPKFGLDFLNPWTWLKTTIKIRFFKYDYVFFNWVSPVMTPIFFPLSLMIKYLTKSEPVMICHNSIPHEKRFVDGFLTNLVFKRCNYFICHSKKDKENIEKINPKAKIISSVLPNLNDFPKKESNKTDKKIILFFGFVRPYKGLDILIEAMKKLDVTLMIVGEFWKGKEKYNLDKIKDKVIVIDKYIPDKDVHMYFNKADILVLPYKSASQSGIVQTSYYFGKPVIVTDVGGLSEAVEDGVTGYVVPPEDPDAIVEAVNKFYNSDIDFENNIKSKEDGWEQYKQDIESELRIVEVITSLK